MRNIIVASLVVAGFLSGPGLALGDDNIVWVRQIGTSTSDKWGEVATDSKRRIIVGGYTQGGWQHKGKLDMLLAKYNPAGELRWMQQLGTAEDEKINALTVDHANRIIVCGYTSGSLASRHQGSIDGILAKYSPTGKLLWVRQSSLSTPEWDYLAGVAVDAADNIYVVGYTEGSLARPSLGYRDFILVKYSPDGELLWRRQFGGPDLDAAYSVATDPAGDIFIGGFTRNSLDGVNQGNADAFIAKYTPDGDRLWIRQLGTDRTEGVSGLATDSEGNVAIGGRTSGAIGGPYLGTVDTFVAKYSNDGLLLWTRHLASRKFERLYDLAIDPADDILVVGHTDGVLGSDEGQAETFPEDPYSANDAFVAKYTPDGALLWIQQFGSADGLEGGYGVAADSDHYVFAVGKTSGSFGGAHQGESDAFLVKLAP